MMKLDSIRKEYRYSVLSEELLPDNPLHLFKNWLNEAIEAKVIEPTAMSVSTVGSDGFPQSRIVLLKDFNKNGFVFFTNYSSEKAKAIQANAAVGLLLFWPEIERQIRISGFAEKTTDKISDQYFHSRPLPSQAAAIVSNQSKIISSRKELEEQFEKLFNELPEENYNRPENWGGYLIKPMKIEFWQGRENRLHDRILYEKVMEKWKLYRLAP